MINTRLTPNEMTNQMRSIDVQLIFVPYPWNCEGFKLYRWMILNLLEGYYNERFVDNTMDIQYDTSNETVVPKESPFNILNTSFNLDDIASIMFTSGTTGPQKRCHKRFVIIMPVQSDVKRAWDLIVILIGYLSCRFIIFRSQCTLRAVIEGFTVRIVDKFNAEQILTMIKMNASRTFRLCHKL